MKASDLITMYAVLTDPDEPEAEWPSLDMWTDDRDQAIARARRLSDHGTGAVVYTMTPTSIFRGRPI
jgi:hypothetical protein